MTASVFGLRATSARNLLLLGSLLAASSDCMAATQFVWAHSGSPAPALSVQVKATAGGKSLTSDSGGQTETIAAGSEVTVHDSETQLDLLLIPAGSAIPNPIRVPEPIRLSGTVEGNGDARKGLIVQYGFGERVTPNDRLRRLYDSYSRLEVGADTTFGLTLPRSALRWGNALIAANGSYLTPFFPATEDPQVLAYNASRAFGLRDVVLPARLEPRTTVAAGPLALTPSASLTINYQAPATPVAVDAQVFLKAARIDPRYREPAARMLSVLDRLDPRLFVFATGIRPYNVSAGRVVIAGLPPFADMDVHVMGALTSNGFDRTVRPGDSELAFSSGDLLPKDGKAPLRGIVVIEGSYAPVKNATVVYSCYPEKIEMKTNDAGEFGIPGACAGRDITLFVTATDWMEPPRFAPAQMRKQAHVAQGMQPLVIALPAIKRASGTPRARLPKRPDMSPAALARNRETQKSYYAPIRGSRVEPWFQSSAIPPGEYYLEENNDDKLDPTVYVWAPGTTQVNNVLDIRWVDSTHVDIIVGITGKWAVLAADGALIIGGNDSVDFDANVPKRVEINMLTYFKSLLVVISAYGPFACSECAVYIANPAVDPDPTEIDTTESGVADLGVLDNNTLHVFVANPRYGYYDCDVKLDFRRDVDVFLLPAADSPCPTLKSQTP
jgi:hypothetical protein